MMNRIGFNPAVNRVGFGIMERYEDEKDAKVNATKYAIMKRPTGLIQRDNDWILVTDDPQDALEGDQTLTAAKEVYTSAAREGTGTELPPLYIVKYSDKRDLRDPELIRFEAEA